MHLLTIRGTLSLHAQRAFDRSRAFFKLDPKMDGGIVSVVKEVEDLKEFEFPVLDP